MGEERNFRSHYYEKVGFRGVEERRSLEILLGEKPLNLQKLTQFCLRFSLPSMHREYVWKIILGALPRYPDNQQLICDEQKEEYQELCHCLKIIEKIDDFTPQPEMLVYMVLLGEGQLRLNNKQQLMEPSSQNLMSIATTFTRMFPEPDEAFVLLRSFWKIQLQSSNSISNLVDRFHHSLKLEDPVLFQHFQSISAFHILPLNTWFSRCFAETIPENSLERIWDKVICGSSKILVNLAMALVTTLRRPLLNIDSSSDLLSFLKKIPEDTADCVVNKALETWHANNS